jgi:hypothetical protein
MATRRRPTLPHARFGGRGGDNLPYPYQRRLPALPPSLRQHQERQPDAYQEQRADNDRFIGDRHRSDPRGHRAQRDFQQRDDAIGAEGGGWQGNQRQQHVSADQELEGYLA